MYFMNSSGLQTHESTVTQKVKVVFARDGRGVLSNTLPTRDDFSSSDGNGVLEITVDYGFFFFWCRIFLFNGCSRYSLVVHADTN